MYATGNMKIRAIVLISVLVSFFSVGDLFSAVVTVIDSFTEAPGTVSSTGAFASQHDTGLETVLGGERFYFTQATAGATAVQIGTPFSGVALYVSTSTGFGSGGMTYGYGTPLNVDLSRSGLIFGFRLGGFGADEPGMTGDISLRVVTSGGTDEVTKPIATFVNNPIWLHEEFTGVDFTNVERLELSWGNFTQPGADLDFQMFGTVNGLPEPGTMSMLILALGVILLARKRTRAAPEPVPVRASGPSTMMNSMSSTSDLYSLPNRSF